MTKITQISRTPEQLKKSIIDKLYREKNKEKIALGKAAYTARTKEEKRAYDVKYRQENAASKRVAGAEYRANNKLKIVAYKADHYKANKAQINAKNSLYAKENSEKLAIAQAKYYFENKEKISEVGRLYRASNKEAIAARNAAYTKNNPAVRQAGHAKRRALKRNSSGSYTASDVKALLKSQKCKCPVCKIGLETGHHVDHIQPLAKGGSNDKLNIQLLCPSCNMSKKARDPIDFMQSRGFLL